MKLTDERIEEIRQQPQHHQGEFDYRFDERSFARAIEAEVLRLNGITRDGSGGAPLESSKEASDAIDAMLAEYNYQSNTKNAARAGWRACRLYSAQPQQQQAAPGAVPDAVCRHENGHPEWDYWQCDDCGWISPSGQKRGPHNGFFPTLDCAKEWDKYRTYPGMDKHLSAPKPQEPV